MKPIKRGTNLKKRLEEIVSYNPETGVFYWKNLKNKNKKFGAEVKSKEKEGYIVINHKGKQYRAHRIAWLFYYGYMPIKGIDHINRDKTDNRIANLRLANDSQNAANVGLNKNNKTGVPGIFWCKKSSKWRLRTIFMGNRVELGRFKTKEEAAKAYFNFKSEHYGEFFNKDIINEFSFDD